MKNLIIVFMFLASIMFAQEKIYSIPESKLTQDQKLELQKQQIVSTIEGVSYFKGVGKEVGEAVSSGLSALNKEVNSFSESSAGKFTMFIIAYKVVGNDFVQFLIGIPLWLIGSSLLAYFFWKDSVIHRVLVSKEGYIWNKKKVYQIVNEDKKDGTMYLVYGIYFIILSIVSGLVTFG